MPLQLREAKIETSIDDRKQRRHRLLLEAEGRGDNTASGEVLVHDISDTGLLIETIYALGIGEMIEVNHPCAGVLMEAEIMWAAGQIYGCKFTRERTQAAVSAEQRGGALFADTCRGKCGGSRCCRRRAKRRHSGA